MAFALCFRDKLPFEEMFDKDFDHFDFPVRVKSQKMLSCFAEEAKNRRMVPYQLLSPFRSSRIPIPNEKDAVVTNDSENFRVKLNVSGFSPEELTVKMAGNVLSVEGKHEEKAENGGLVWNHFVRKFSVPKDVDVESLASSLETEKDGVLTISAKKKPVEKSNEQKIPIVIEKEKEKKIENPEETSKTAAPESNYICHID